MSVLLKEVEIWGASGVPTGMGIGLLISFRAGIIGVEIV